MFISRNVLVVVACALGLLAACSESSAAPVSRSVDPAKANAIMKIVRDYMGEAHLKAVIVRVTVDGKEIVTAAEGESMTGVPAATDMHFRNGAVAISYVSTLLLKLVDERKISLGDKLSKYLPDMPHADEITIHQLALKNTRPNLTAQIPEPALHAFSSERRGFFNIAAGEPFYEESTYWNPSWTINHGAIQTSNIYDLEHL